MKRSLATLLPIVAVAACAFAACAGNANSPMPSAGTRQPVSLSRVDTDTAPEAGDIVSAASILNGLTHTTTIGSTVDSTGSQNPYGLAIAPVTSGLLHAGDLVVCNFNDATNVQGTGKDIIALHPTPGSTPLHILVHSALLGCTEVAMSPSDDIWASAFVANDNPIVSSSGSLTSVLAGGPWHNPFGEVFAPHGGPGHTPAFFVSNAGDGSIVRVNVAPGCAMSFDVIATGFAINHGPPGSILGPSGLQYDDKHDRLYIVDGTNNTLVSFKHVSTIPAHGITVSGTTFGGPFKKRAKLIFSGSPLNGPISSALLPGGHLVLGNTLDPDGKNIMVEIGANGKLIATKNVDTGPAGALFGMVGTGTNAATAKIWFNDDNDNTVKVLTH